MPAALASFDYGLRTRASCRLSVLRKPAFLPAASAVQRPLGDENRAAARESLLAGCGRRQFVLTAAVERDCQPGANRAEANSSRRLRIEHKFRSLMKQPSILSHDQICSFRGGASAPPSLRPPLRRLPSGAPLSSGWKRFKRPASEASKALTRGAGGTSPGRGNWGAQP